MFIKFFDIDGGVISLLHVFVTYDVTPQPSYSDCGLLELYNQAQLPHADAEV